MKTWQDRQNYEGKTAAEMGLTQHLDTSGAFSNTIIGASDKYQIGLYDNMITHEVEATPFLQITQNMGTIPANAPIHSWTDEYRGEMWYDIALDNMRLRNSSPGGAASNIDITLSGYGAKYNVNAMPHEITSASYKGGVQPFCTIKVLSGDPTKTLLDFPQDEANIAVTTLSGDSNASYGALFAHAQNEVMLVIKKDNDKTVGNIEDLYARMHMLLTNLKYDKVTGNLTGSAGAVTRFTHNKSTSHAPVFMAFDEIHVANGYKSAANNNNAAFASGGAISSYQQVFVRIKDFGVVESSAPYVFFNLDFNTTNIDLVSPIAKYVAYSNRERQGVYDSVLVSVPVPNGTPVIEDTIFLNTGGSGAEYSGKTSRLVHVGRSDRAPQPIPEGDNFAPGGNFTSWRETLTNFTQIFVTPKYGITGTHQASQFRFGDMFRETREYWLTLYKQKRESAMLWGVKGETVAISTDNGFLSGQPVRAMGGLMDQALFPITFLKKPLASGSYSGGVNDTLAFVQWIDDLTDRLSAFRHRSESGFTFLVSEKFLRRLNIYARKIQATKELMGGEVGLVEQSALNFGLKIHTFQAANGAMVKFIHEPALDLMTGFPVPYWKFGKADVSPRDILISIDTANIRNVTLRPDRIEGNVQDRGQDAFMEGMRGEHSFQLRYPKNHAIIWAPEV